MSDYKCKACDHQWSLPAGAAPTPCPACGAKKIARLVAAVTPESSEGAETSAPIADATAAAEPVRQPAAVLSLDPPRLEGGRSRAAASALQRRRVVTARTWILIIAIGFALFGTISGISGWTKAVEATRTLTQRFDADEIVSVPELGVSMRRDELVARIQIEARLVFAVNYGLAAVLVGLFVWARRSPLPAMITTLCLFLAVNVANAIMDPNSLFAGVVVKILFMSAIIAGIKSALAERAALAVAEQARPAPQ